MAQKSSSTTSTALIHPKIPHTSTSSQHTHPTMSRSCCKQQLPITNLIVSTTEVSLIGNLFCARRFANASLQNTTPTNELRLCSSLQSDLWHHGLAGGGHLPEPSISHSDSVYFINKPVKCFVPIPLVFSECRHQWQKLQKLISMRWVPTMVLCKSGRLKGCVTLRHCCLIWLALLQMLDTLIIPQSNETT